MSETIVVTGAAGFIGSNIIRALNARGITDILAVDDLTQGEKFHNLLNCQIGDYWDKDDFLLALVDEEFNGAFKAIFHQGACVNTLERDGKKMMADNFQLSRCLLDFAEDEEIPLIYASSAAVYGRGINGFDEIAKCEAPLNVYGYSKLLFDQTVRRRLADAKGDTQIVGLRYFNVYGPHEQHKGRMASVAYHVYHQFQRLGWVELFAGDKEYADGEQKRDFIYVDDVVAANLYALDNPHVRGVFNLGTGRAEAFNQLASGVINACRELDGLSAFPLGELQKLKLIRYIDMPADLRGAYQSFTQANMEKLRQSEYRAPFKSVAEGTAAYVQHLKKWESR